MSSSLNDFLAEATERMRADGLLVENLIADGDIHTCSLVDKTRSTSGRYLIHADEPMTAWWKNWKTDAWDTYCAKPEKEMTRKERKKFQERIRAAKEKAALEQEKKYKEGAQAAQALWNSAREATNHPYLERKGVKAFGLRIDRRDNLLVPVLDESGKIMSVQKIRPEKPENGPEKPFLRGCKTSGGFYPITATDGAKDGVLCICEGYATGASIHEATGNAVLIAFMAGNLLAVSKMAREKYPARKICLCADFDIPKNDSEREKYQEPGGIGVADAREAAQAIGGYLAVPPSLDGEATDFNDLHCKSGIASVSVILKAALAKGPVTDCPMPPNFRLVKEGKRAGLYYIDTKDDGTFEEKRLGPPLEVLAATRDAEGNDWGLMLRWHDLDKREHTWAMPQSLLYGQRNEWLPMLANGGWLGVPYCRKELAIFLSSVRPLRRIQCVPNTGWHDDRYVLPDNVYGSGEDELMLQPQARSNLYQCGGTMEGWKNLANLCAGNSRLEFALACAFAGPLLQLVGLEGGGFSLEGQSSSGKTTCLEAAASVWGGRQHVRSWRTTDNALENLASLHNDNLLILDELSQINARALDEAIYMLSNGAGKSRAGRDGSLRKSCHWRALILSSGELGLAEKLLEDGRKARAGQEVRLAAIPTEKTDITELHDCLDASQLTRRIKELAGQHYGHAGRIFLERLTREGNLANEATEARQIIESLLDTYCPKGADGQVKRVAMRFILAGYAAERAKQWEILPESFRTMETAQACFTAWLEQRGGAGAAEDKAILEQVQGIIERDGQSRFQNLEAEDAICVNRLGFVKHGENRDEFIILPKQFKIEFAKGFSEKQVIRVLREAGWLEIGSQGRNKTRRTLPGLGRQQVYVIHVPEDKNLDCI